LTRKLPVRVTFGSSYLIPYRLQRLFLGAATVTIYAIAVPGTVTCNRSI